MPWLDLWYPKLIMLSGEEGDKPGTFSNHDAILGTHKIRGNYRRGTSHQS